jgi:hypothetical protein
MMGATVTRRVPMAVLDVHFYSDASTLPTLWVSCGRRDELLAHSEHFVEGARAAGADPHVEYPDGVHEWGLWDAQIRRVLDWLPLR